jgi:hypothetical protein
MGGSSSVGRIDMVTFLYYRLAIPILLSGCDYQMKSTNRKKSVIIYVEVAKAATNLQLGNRLIRKAIALAGHRTKKAA